jgi:hypothetical protein
MKWKKCEILPDFGEGLKREEGTKGELKMSQKQA